MMVYRFKSFRTRGTMFLLVACAAWSARANGQDPLKTLPNNYKLAFENSAVAVIRAHYGPHEKVPVHDHASSSTVFVYLNDSGPVRIEHEDEGVISSVVRPPTFIGSYRIAPALKERHRIENMGDTSSDFLRVELKQVSLDLKEPFRGKAPSMPLQAEDLVEFTAPAVQVERIVCAERSPCDLKAASAPSLVIALTPLEMGEKLAVGMTRWVAAGQALTMRPDGASPAHILRILLPDTAK
ncbi:hypothetical protein [Granulicella arctica]|uniref:hypothetical protein n=1 Tax=Granulicella arctica TaxID=940613 RepID=UPI0021DFB6A5|nr:hypothetical protein [Granulicella arctica]